MYRSLKNGSSKDFKNERLLISASFMTKIAFGFCLNTGKHIFLEVSFKTKRKSIDSSKKRYRGFPNSPPFQRLACFYVTMSVNFERFWKTKTFFKKPEKYLSVESTKIENLSPYKTVISEASVNRNSMVSTN